MRSTPRPHHREPGRDQLKAGPAPFAMACPNRVNRNLSDQLRKVHALSGRTRGRVPESRERLKVGVQKFSLGDGQTWVSTSR